MINKILNKRILTVLVGLSFLVSSCNKVKDFGDIDTNPNGAPTPLTKTLLTNVLTGLSGVPANTNPGFYTQYYSETIYPGNQMYAVTAVAWSGFYAGALEDCQNIINTCTAHASSTDLSGNTVNQIQIARILKVYTYSILTDRYGDIPYSAALQGNSAVPYDKQQDIYTDFFKELKEANAAFQDGVGTAVVGDIMYDGDLSKWKKFANSLRLIFAMRLSKVDPATGKTEFMSALNDPNGLISDNADNFQLKFPGGSYNNPWYNLTGAYVSAISAKMADRLNTLNDPRVYAYGQANSSGIVLGIPYGLNSAHLSNFVSAFPDWSSCLGVPQKKDTSTQVIIPAAYIDLLRAEAAVDPNYNSGENSFDLVQSAISKSWEQWGVSGDLSSYLVSIGANGGPVAKSTIQEQTWIALYATSQNAWNEWRRSCTTATPNGVPALLPTADAINETHTIPRRYQYPLTEPNVNPGAYNAAIAAFPYGGTDVHNNRVWWDKP